MGAQEIINVLKKNENKEFTTLELANLMEANRRTISRVLASLLKEAENSRDVGVRLLTPEEKIERYNRDIPKSIRVFFIRSS